MIERFSKADILEIEDISAFVKEQYQHVLNRQLEQLMVPEEKPLVFEKETLNTFLRLQ
jgi:hypothetical protein